ncbi:hypothetical protein BTIS_1949 [Bifidobacterium tissieri]|uniref:Histidine kinase n=1 Tax=Bifidobacterium tissieri TaxID=1630162 RepID=A0A261F8U3_9BIFI|nr:hypothetical protein [Bifidobacterium tissieri]OZG55577.1 hypothetical protein BTIS_1949 [Bifidobacterium tissieri]
MTHQSQWTAWITRQFPYLSAALALLALAMVDAISRATWMPLGIGYFGVFLMLDVVMACRPMIGSVSMMAFSIIGSLITQTVSPNPIVTAMVALIILGYRRPKLGLILGCMEIVCPFINIALRYPVDFDLYSAVNMCALTALCYFIGYALRWKDQAAKAAVLKSQLGHLQHTLTVATALHDTTSSNLSNIMQVTQMHLINKEDASKDDWQLINVKATEALHGVHHVIALLDADKQSTEVEPRQSFMEQLESCVRFEETTLRNAGFTGTTFITGVGNPSSHQRGQAVLDALSEIYRNIERHANPDFFYKVSISIDNSISILASNTCRDKHLCSIPHGKGLKVHTKRIASLGGTFTSHKNGNQWNVILQMPLR